MLPASGPIAWRFTTRVAPKRTMIFLTALMPSKRSAYLPGFTLKLTTPRTVAMTYSLGDVKGCVADVASCQSRHWQRWAVDLKLSNECDTGRKRSLLARPRRPADSGRGAARRGASLGLSLTDGQRLTGRERLARGAFGRGSPRSAASKSWQGFDQRCRVSLTRRVLLNK